MTVLIGVTTYREEATWGVWRQRADVLQVEYADAVVRAGGVPVLLPRRPPTSTMPGRWWPRSPDWS